MTWTHDDVNHIVNHHQKYGGGYALMEICRTPDCSECGGGWVRVRRPTRAEIRAYMNDHEPGPCPVCGEVLQFECIEAGKI